PRDPMGQQLFHAQIEMERKKVVHESDLVREGRVVEGRAAENLDPLGWHQMVASDEAEERGFSDAVGADQQGSAPLGKRELQVLEEERGLGRVAEAQGSD